MDEPTNPSDPPPCERTRFLVALLDDEERGRLQPLAHYLAAHPDIADFVRTEYAALARPAGPAAVEATPLPARIGRYEVTGALGSGGMGTVYAAVDPQLGRRVVVKSLHPALARDAAAHERLRREARVLGSLDHAGLVKVIDVVEADGGLHLVMPFHDGRTLGAHLADARSASGADAGWLWLPGATDRGASLRALVGFVRAAALALAHAHRAGVVHRDLKPDNLLVLADGSPLVLDFGLSQPGDEVRLTAVGEVVGTPLYMAPEQIEGQPATPATDVYALGVVLYEALTLVHPFAGAGGRAGVFQRILIGDPVPPRKHQPRLARDLEAVALRAIERDPARRYPNAAAFAADLKRVLDLEPTDARPLSAVTAAWRRVRRRPRASAAVALLVILGGAAALAVSEALRLRAQQASARDELQALHAAPHAAPVREQLGRVLQRMRSLAFEPGPSLLAVHPRGAVAAVDAIAWIGLAACDDNLLPGVQCVHRYRVEVRAADGAVAAVFEHDADPATRWCEVAWPTGAPAAGSWQVAWIGARMPDGSFVAATAAEQLAHQIIAPFAVAAASGHAEPSPSAALRAALHPGAAAPVGERLRAAEAAATALGDAGLAARLVAEQRSVEDR
jgi:tRNA A-37 threonylcarbamoyl transferase component Bud32